MLVEMVPPLWESVLWFGMPIKHLVVRPAICPLLPEPSLDDLKQGSVRNFNLSISLWVGERQIVVLDS